VSLPVHDWQFWVVTALALVAALTTARKLLPARWRPWGRKPRGRGATLTVGGRTVKRP